MLEFETTVSFFTCVCFFVSRGTDLDTFFTSCWTSANIWFNFSTFSFFTALICQDTNNAKVRLSWVCVTSCVWVDIYYVCITQEKDDAKIKDLTFFKAVVTGFALFLLFKCLLATWKTFFCFLPFCLFFAISPEGKKEGKFSVNMFISLACSYTFVLWFPCLFVWSTHRIRYTDCSKFLTVLWNNLVVFNCVYA